MNGTGGAKLKQLAVVASTVALSGLLGGCGPSGKVMTEQLAQNHPQAVVACELPSTQRCRTKASATSTVYWSCSYIKSVQLPAERCLENGGVVTQDSYQRLLMNP